MSERDQLAAELEATKHRVVVLEASTQSLGDELEATLEQYEDLAVERDELAADVAALRNTEVALSTELTSTSLELAAKREKLAAARAELDKLNQTYTSLMSDLEAEVASGQIEIEQLREGIRVNVSDEIIFSSGSARLDPVGRDVLSKVIDQVKELEHTIEVQGHTDDVPIRGSLSKRYPTNWELAAARASRVVRLMQERGIDGERLSVVSHASFQPVAPNDSAEGRALNRRIEIRLVPKPGVGREAVAASASEDEPQAVANEPVAASGEPVADAEPGSTAAAAAPGGATARTASGEAALAAAAAAAPAAAGSPGAVRAGARDDGASTGPGDDSAEASAAARAAAAGASGAVTGVPQPMSGDRGTGE